MIGAKPAGLSRWYIHAIHKDAKVKYKNNKEHISYNPFFLFVCGVSSHSRISHSYGDVLTIDTSENGTNEQCTITVDLGYIETILDKISECFIGTHAVLLNINLFPN